MLRSQIAYSQWIYLSSLSKWTKLVFSFLVLPFPQLSLPTPLPGSSFGQLKAPHGSTQSRLLIMPPQDLELSLPPLSHLKVLS